MKIATANLPIGTALDHEFPFATINFNSPADCVGSWNGFNE